MKVIKPSLLGFLWKTYRRNGHRLALTGMVCFSFHSPDNPLPESEMWEKTAPEFAPGCVWDAGVPKDRGEVLLSARCCSPAGEPIPFRRVSVRVGNVAKSLDVFGDRNWEKKGGVWQKTEPRPFQEMPVVFSRAFGGNGYPDNPSGKGFVEDPGEGPIPLPNIESPEYPVASLSDRPGPAGLETLDITWRQRFSKVGSYASGELGKDYPALPANADWTLYNQALPDQWLPGFWNGGEPFVLEGFSPRNERQEGVLPNLLIRSFVTLADDAGSSFVEVSMVSETVWLFPHLGIGVVIHRGSLPVGTDDAAEVRSVLLAAEDPGEKRPASHYLDFRNRRETRDPKDLSLYGEAPLLPERLENDPLANRGNVRYQLSALPSGEEQRTKRILFRRLDRMREGMVQRLNASPDPSPGGKEAALKALDQRFEGMRTEIESRSAQNPLAAMEAAMRESDTTQIEEKLRKAVARISDEDLRKAGLSREDFLSRKAPQAPSKGASEKRFENMLARIREAGSSGNGIAPSGTSELEFPPEMAKSMVRSVHMFSPPPPDPRLSREKRQEVQDDLGENRDFRNRDLRGADLSGLDLSGCDFSECDLLGADFSESNLTGASFSGAWAAHCRFREGTLSRADFSGANLGCSDFSGIRAETASFEKSVLSGASFADCDLSGSNFSGADLFGTTFQRAKIRGASFPKAKFMRVGQTPSPFAPSPAESPKTPEEDPDRILFEEVDFSGSVFEKSLFMKADFRRVDFSGCRLAGVSFFECSGPGTRFDGANLAKAVFVQSPDFSRSSFREADLTGANLRDVSVMESDFRGAILSGTDGSGGDWRHANLTGVVAVQARFQKTDLRHADGRSGDFRQSLFLKADLRFADFREASLYKAGVVGATTDDTTRLDGALTGKTMLGSEETHET